jgi:hypothetical protein
MSSVVFSPVRAREAGVTSDWTIVLGLSLIGGLLCAMVAIWSPGSAEALTLMS